MTLMPLDSEATMATAPFLRSVVAFVCGEDQDIKAEVERLIHFYGGHVLRVYDADICTHVIAAAATMEDATCKKASHAGNPIYTDLWLKSCIEEQRVLPLSAPLHYPPVSATGIPGAEKLVVCLTGFGGELRKELQFMASLVGAGFSKPLKVFEVTHLLCYDFSGDKYMVAKARGIKTVNHFWLHDCYMAWRLLPEDSYAQSSRAVEEQRSSGRPRSQEAMAVGPKSEGLRTVRPPACPPAKNCSTIEAEDLTSLKATDVSLKSDSHSEVASGKVAENISKSPALRSIPSENPSLPSLLTPAASLPSKCMPEEVIEHAMSLPEATRVAGHARGIEPQMCKASTQHPCTGRAAEVDTAQISLQDKKFESEDLPLPVDVMKLQGKSLGSNDSMLGLKGSSPGQNPGHENGNDSTLQESMDVERRAHTRHMPNMEKDSSGATATLEPVDETCPRQVDHSKDDWVDDKPPLMPVEETSTKVIAPPSPSCALSEKLPCAQQLVEQPSKSGSTEGVGHSNRKMVADGACGEDNLLLSGDGTGIDGGKIEKSDGLDKGSPCSDMRMQDAMPLEQPDIVSQVGGNTNNAIKLQEMRGKSCVDGDIQQHDATETEALGGTSLSNIQCRGVSLPATADLPRGDPQEKMKGVRGANVQVEDKPAEISCDISVQAPEALEVPGAEHPGAAESARNGRPKAPSTQEKKRQGRKGKGKTQRPGPQEAAEQKEELEMRPRPRLFPKNGHDLGNIEGTIMDTGCQVETEDNRPDAEVNTLEPAGGNLEAGNSTHYQTSGDKASAGSCDQRARPLTGADDGPGLSKIPTGLTDDSEQQYIVRVRRNVRNGQKKVLDSDMETCSSEEDGKDKSRAVVSVRDSTHKEEGLADGNLDMTMHLETAGNIVFQIEQPHRTKSIVCGEQIQGKKEMGKGAVPKAWKKKAVLGVLVAPADGKDEPGVAEDPGAMHEGTLPPWIKAGILHEAPETLKTFKRRRKVTKAGKDRAVEHLEEFPDGGLPDESKGHGLPKSGPFDYLGTQEVERYAREEGNKFTASNGSRLLQSSTTTASSPVQKKGSSSSHNPPVILEEVKNGDASHKIAGDDVKNSRHDPRRRPLTDNMKKANENQIAHDIPTLPKKLKQLRKRDKAEMSSPSKKKAKQQILDADDENMAPPVEVLRAETQVSDGTASITKKVNVRCFTFGGIADDRTREGLKRQVLKLGGKVSNGDDKQWDKRATHVVLGSPLKRTEKLLGAAAAGRWILQASYVKESAAKRSFLPEADHEWYGEGLNEDRNFSLSAPRLWRENQMSSGMRAFHGLQIGLLDDIGPRHGPLLRILSGAGGTVHQLSVSERQPTETVLKKLDVLVMAAEMTPESMQLGKRMKDLNGACVAPEYFLEYIARPGSDLYSHVLFDTHTRARAAMALLQQTHGTAGGSVKGRKNKVVKGGTYVSRGDDVEEGSLDLGGSVGADDDGDEEATSLKCMVCETG